MSYQDKHIRCCDCGDEFTFTASEQQFFADKGVANEPKRCPACRRAKRGSAASSSNGRTALRGW
jgi:hypothetical protein